jgi:hypothetical protein
MVAWHEMPGEYTDMTPPVGNGVIRDTQTLSTFQDNRTPSPTNHTVPYGTISRCDVSRHFMPGYRHVVPPGQRFRCPKLVLMRSAVGRSRRSRRSGRSRRFKCS